MIVNSLGVVIANRDLGEFDRLITVYTQDRGKIPVRLVWVRRPQAKLLTFSQVAVWAEFRLYLKPRSHYSKGIGGAILSVFPRIRQSWAKTLKAMYLCELMDKLTPEHQPNSYKYDLLVSALEVLERTPGFYLPVAFGLRLLGHAGFHDSGTAPKFLSASSLWECLHDSDLQDLEKGTWDPEQLSLCREWLEDRVREVASRELQTPRFFSLISP